MLRFESCFASVTALAISTFLICEVEADLIIDNFAVDQDFLVTESQTIALSDPGFAGVTATRTGNLEGTASDGNIITFYQTTQGNLAFTQLDTGSMSDMTLSLKYDSFSSTTIDLTFGDGLVFSAFDYTSNALPNSDLVLTSTVTSPVSSTSTTIVQPQNNMPLTIRFSDFSPAFDFSAVASIEFSFQMQGGGSLRQISADSVRATPEPATITLCSTFTGIGIISMWSRRRRRSVSSTLPA